VIASRTFVSLLIDAGYSNDGAENYRFALKGGLADSLAEHAACRRLAFYLRLPILRWIAESPRKRIGNSRKSPILIARRRFFDMQHTLRAIMFLLGINILTGISDWD